jgi:hypothetical protein
MSKVSQVKAARNVVAAVVQVATHLAAQQAPAWVPMPKYATTIANTVAGGASPASGPVLVSVGVTTARAGTARAAALAALLASVGQPRNVVLAAVAQSEKSWHMAQGRTPGQVSPAGWLRTFAATFA